MLVVAAGLCVFVLAVAVERGPGPASSWAAVVGLPAVLFAGIAAWLALAGWRPGRRGLAGAPLPPKWTVDRPDEMAEVVKVLRRGRGGVAGITTGLHGAGGFGKTTLAMMACADRQVRWRFRGRVYWVRMGQDVRGPAAVAAKIGDVVTMISGEKTAFPDPVAAGIGLRALLKTGPRRLLVLDDVWQEEQLAPFTRCGKRCALLVTTRIPGLLNQADVAVKVNQMRSGQARELLTSGARLPPALTKRLLEATGRWPLLLRIVAQILANADQVGTDADIARVAELVLARLRDGGLASVVDLDVRRPEEREQAVRATIEASTSFLDDPQDAERCDELGVFAQGEVIPFALICLLWQATGGLDHVQASQLCERLAGLALVSRAGTGPGGVTVHDETRDSLRRKLGPQQLATLQGVLLDQLVAGLPAALSLVQGAAGPPQVAWWEPSQDDRYHLFTRYLRDHLIEHLRGAGRHAEAEAVACDLRWARVRLAESGPAALAADLSRAGTPRAARLLAVLARMSHLLAPAEPPSLVADVLYCRVADDPDWGAQVTALRGLGLQPGLASRWPLPDIPGPALRRILTGAAGAVNAVAIAPDGTWLAAGGTEGKVRIWEQATGKERADLTGHSGSVNAIAAAPDGTWLATGSDDGTARIWDAPTGPQQAALTPLTGRAARTARTAITVLIRRHVVRAVAIAPDGSWLAVGSNDGTARIWDDPAPANENPATRRQRAALTAAPWTNGAALTGISAAIVISALTGISVLIFDLVRNPRLIADVGHRARASTPVRKATPVNHDGFWARLARISEDVGSAERHAFHVVFHDLSSPLAISVLVSLCLLALSWELPKKLFPVLTRHAVNAVAVAPEGTWLVTGGADGTARIWDQVTGKERAVLTGHSGSVNAVAVAPEGTWLVTGGADGTARIWDQVTGKERAVLTGHSGSVNAVAVAPDGTWLVTGGADGTARIWDQVTGKERAVLTGHSGSVNAVAVAPDGTWLATGGADGTARIWDPAAGKEQTAATPRIRAVNAVAVAPDGTWLATGGADGTARIWDQVTGKERAVLTGHSGSVNAVAVAPEGTWLVTGGADGKVRIWDQVTGKERAVLTGHSGSVNAVAVAPDGTWLATGGADGTIRIWDQATRRKRAVLTGKLATGGGDWAARSWDRVAEEWELGVIFGYNSTLNVLAIAPDGSWLVATNGGGMVSIWDPATGQERIPLTLYRSMKLALADYWNSTTRQKGKTRALTEATDVTAAVIAPDGSWLATGSSDGTARIWDAVALRERAVLSGHSGAVDTVAITSDGTWLTTGSADGTVQIWETATWRPWSLMRVDGAISSCAWLGSAGLAVLGTAGLFLFDFPAGTTQPPASARSSLP